MLSIYINQVANITDYGSFHLYSIIFVCGAILFELKTKTKFLVFYTQISISITTVLYLNDEIVIACEEATKG